ncbi:hemerythrin family protein [Methylomonas paludis]|uniref:Hemerythrin family protein n=1 Tax=Methylomonas paludis TaxID=1173101 RepID=A0A975R968_9GAMM|nr:hemerythrin family protein [Methylomonas paludis]QWF69861.1 hemerythrin family protein [Methylomonas paludis]
MNWFTHDNLDQLDHSEIDQDHQQFYDLLKSLEQVDNADFPAHFQELYRLTEAHFEMEDDLMTSHEYPGAADHQAEHQRVLGEFKQFQLRVNKGLISFGRVFARERLCQWFVLHISTMDSALVSHIKTRSPR